METQPLKIQLYQKSMNNSLFGKRFCFTMANIIASEAYINIGNLDSDGPLLFVGCKSYNIMDWMGWFYMAVRLLFMDCLENYMNSIFYSVVLHEFDLYDLYNDQKLACEDC